MIVLGESKIEEQLEKALSRANKLIEKQVDADADELEERDRRRGEGARLARPGECSDTHNTPTRGRYEMRGAGRATFAAVLLLIAGTLNIIYGIGALDSANIFVNDKRYIFTNLNTMGWVLIVLGVIQLTGGFSLLAGNTYGRVIGIVGASLGAIGALFSIGGANPWWSLAIFVLCVWIVYGILVLGEDERGWPPEAVARPCEAGEPWRATSPPSSSGGGA